MACTKSSGQDGLDSGGQPVIPTEELTSLWHQLCQSEAVAKQLGILLVQRNREIEALLQEMRKDWCDVPGSATIPAYWGQGLQTLHKLEDAITQSAQNATGLDAAEPAFDLSMGSLPLDSRAKGSLDTSLCTAKEHGRSGLALSSQPVGQLAEGYNPKCDRISRLASLDPKNCRVDEACSRARFCEVFWAVLEWPAAMDGFMLTAEGRQVDSLGAAAGPPSRPHNNSQAIPQEQAASDALLASDTTRSPAEPNSLSPSGMDGTSKENITSQPACTQATADQLEVAVSQNSALQSLVASLQGKLGRAAARDSALQHQARSAGLRAERLQALGGERESEQASWVQGSRPEDLSYEMGPSCLTELQLIETALLDALQHEEVLMEQIIGIQHAQSEVAALAGALPLMNIPAECIPADMSQIALSSGAPAEMEASSPLSERPLTEHTAGGSAMTRPSQIVHARSVIAELSDRLAQLECSNALLQDRLAAGSGDLIRSGPDDRWPADAFPWQSAAPAGEGQAYARVAAEDISGEMLTPNTPTAYSQDALPEPIQLAPDTAEPETETHATADSTLQHLQTVVKPRGKGDGQIPDEGSSSLPVPGAVLAGALSQAGESQMETSDGPILSAGEETSIMEERRHSVRPKATLADSEPAAHHSSGAHAIKAQHETAPAPPPALTELAADNGTGNARQPQHAPDVQSRALAIAMSIVSSSEAPANGKPARDSRQAGKQSVRQARHGVLSIESPRMSMQLAAAEQQSASLAATHAELERRLLHAHQQLAGFAATGSAQVPPPAIEASHGIRDAPPHAAAGVSHAVKSSSAQPQPHVEAVPLRQEAAEENGLRPNDASSSEAPQLAELRAELAERAAKHAQVALQLDESERCRERLQQQLLDLWEARAAPGTTESGLCNKPDQSSTRPQQAPRLSGDITGSTETMASSTDAPQAEQFQAGAGQGETSQAHNTVTGSAEIVASSAGVQRLFCPTCGRSEPLAGGEADAALGEARQGPDEVAALRTAMAQSEAVFLDMERQLTAALEREEAAQARIAALEEKLSASIDDHPLNEHKADALAAEEVYQGQQSWGAATPAVQSPVLEGQMAAAGEEPPLRCDAQQQTVTQADTSQRVQLLTEQLRRAHSRASDAEAVVETLQGQLLGQQAAMTALQSSLATALEQADALKAADKRSVAQPAERMLEVDHLEEGPLAVVIMAVGQVQEQSRVSHMGVLTQDHQGLADSMRENPLFSSGLVDLSDEGSDAESDERHRTIRGREAQQIVKRLKGTYRGRSKSANDVLNSGAQGLALRVPQRRQRSRQASAGGRPWTLPSLKRALGGQRSATEGSSALSSALAAAAQEDRDGDEVLQSIYANWGTLQGREDTGQDTDEEELAAAMIQWCASLEKALLEVTGQLAASRASEAALQSRVSSLLTERAALAARDTELEHENNESSARLQGHGGPKLVPSSLPAEANPYAQSSEPETQNASSKAGPRPGAGQAEEGKARGHPCSHFAWELQDLHNRMAAAIAQIRQLEADKAAIAKDLASSHGKAEQGTQSLPRTAGATQDAAKISALYHTPACQRTQEMTETIEKLRAQLLVSQRISQVAEEEMQHLKQASHAYAYANP